MKKIITTHKTKSGLRTLLFTSFVGLASCGLFDGNNTPSFPAPASCTTEDYNQYIYDVMKRYYYWYNQVDPGNSINPRDTLTWTTPQILLEQLKVNPPDRFSGISDASSFSSFYQEGQYLGVGLRLLTDPTTADILIAYAFTGSPAHIAGIRRGDQIVTINDIAANGLSGQAWSDAWGPNEAGVQVKLQIRHPDLTEETVTVAKAVIDIDTTQYSTVIDTGSAKVGYLHFTSFLNQPSIMALSQQFTQFKADQVTELIVDLRYNGGGAVDTANYLGGLIGGSKTEGQIFTQMTYNNKPDGYQGEKVYKYFQTAAEALELSRVFFITTESSCSASELVINALLPYKEIQVIVVGSTSCGKPVGSNTDTHCGKTFAPITFELQNADGQGGYFNGIDQNYSALSTFCPAADSLDKPLGDPTEGSIAGALYYMQNSQCDSSIKQSDLKAIRRNIQNVSEFTASEGYY